MVRGQRPRCASCSSRQTVSLNRNLLFLPNHLVRHILLHKLCHAEHLNHSPRFWLPIARHGTDLETVQLSRGDEIHYMEKGRRLAMNILLNLELDDRQVQQIGSVSSDVELIRLQSEGEILEAMPDVQVVFGDLSEEMFA